MPSLVRRLRSLFHLVATLALAVFLVDLAFPTAEARSEPLAPGVATRERLREAALQRLAGEQLQAGEHGRAYAGREAARAALRGNFGWYGGRLVDEWGRGVAERPLIAGRVLEYRSRGYDDVAGTGDDVFVRVDLRGQRFRDDRDMVYDARGE
jgi:hypothetical protein